MNVSSKGTLLGIAGICAVFGLGFALGYFLSNNRSEISTLAIREYDDRYALIRPLLICQIDEQVESREFKSLERKIESVIGSGKEARNIEDASVYFRDLNSGRWMGVNEEMTYAPASLLKVPIMMALFKEAEQNPGLLSTRFMYTKNPEDVTVLVTKPLLQTGKNYSVSELMRGMIVQSDNSAKDILVNKVNSEVLKDTYAVLGISDPYHPSVTGQPYQISTKKYALFFRALYNGTLLSREASNAAATLLSEVEFDKGLRAGTPLNVPIAHKYGVGIAPVENEAYSIELSDCGIVYNSTSPYLLCVMTRGSDPYRQGEVIKKIAETVYRAEVEGLLR